MSSPIGRLFEIRVNDEILIERTTGRQFRVMFNILHDFGSTNSYADITIVNLSRSTASKALKKGDTIEFIAGYRNSIDVIFRGVINHAIRDKIGTTETGTRVVARSGKLAADRGFVNQSFGPGVTVVDLIRACSAGLELPLIINEPDFQNAAPYAGGYTLAGDPLVYLDALSNAHGFRYLVENDRLVVVGSESYRRGRVYVISQSTGMEGIPEVTEIGANVTTRLDPRIKVGSLFKIESEYRSLNFSNLYFQDVPETAGVGEYRAQRVAFNGDSHGDEWSVTLTGIR